MKALPLLLVAAGAGVAFVWWRNRQAADTRMPGEDEDSKVEGVKGLACAGLSAASLGFISPEACQAGISAGGKLLDVIGTLNDNTKEAEERIARFDAENVALNGEVEIVNGVPQLAGSTATRTATWPRPTTGSALRFANGCEPFAGAPGWNKCAPGTHDMRVSQADRRWGSSSERARAASRPDAPANPDNLVAWGSLLTGSVNPRYPDPSTAGPIPRPDGLLYYVRGKAITCPAGSAPAMWDANGNPIGDHRTGTPACAPGGVSSFVPSSSPPPASTQYGSNGQTQGACVNGQPPAGFTWDPSAGGFLRRLKVGETPNPCPNPDAAVSRALDDSSLLAVLNGGLAARQ
jgi:hypothetical protein